MSFVQQRIARIGQPHEVTLVRPSYADSLIVAVTPAFPGNVVGAKAASAYPSVIPLSDRKVFDTATSAIIIPAVSIPSGSDVTALFVVRKYSGAGTNPGFWRNGSYFFIVNGSNGRPWIRWGSDCLTPSSGFQFVTGGNYNIIYRVKSGSACDFWANGVQQFVGGTPGATPSTSVSIIGYQNDASQKVGELAESYFWTRYLSDNECADLSDTPDKIYGWEDIWIWVPSAGGGTSDIAASGSATASGSAALAVSYNLAAVALAVAGGTAQPVVSVPLSAAGLAVAGGAANATATVTINAAGLAQAAGAAGLAVTVTLAASGGGTAGGSADLSGGAPGDIAASGGAVAGGSALMSATVQISAAGLAQALGAGALVVSIPLAAFGGAVAGGSATLSVVGADGPQMLGFSGSARQATALHASLRRAATLRGSIAHV